VFWRPPETAAVVCWCNDSADPGSADSIMSNNWANGPDVNDALSQYNAFDVSQIRLKLP
jgi:hypothetical protein